MLVLTRKAGQSIIIDGGIEVTIAAVKGGQVRVAISAPPEVGIAREEVRRPQEAAEPKASRPRRGARMTRPLSKGRGRLVRRARGRHRRRGSL